MELLLIPNSGLTRPNDTNIFIYIYIYIYIYIERERERVCMCVCVCKTVVGPTKEKYFFFYLNSSANDMSFFKHIIICICIYLCNTCFGHSSPLKIPTDSIAGQGLECLVHMSSSSSWRAASMDIPDPLSPRLPVIHCLRQVFRVTSRIIT